MVVNMCPLPLVRQCSQIFTLGRVQTVIILSKPFVYDDPSQLFVIASDASLTDEATARTHVFANASLSSGTSGSTSTGMSSAALAVSTIDTTNTLNLRIMGIVDDPANADFGASGIGVVVWLNNHFNSPNGAIAGGTVSTTGV